MKLKKLELSGFKSFPEKAAIHFPTGISAVVGPNGCGKSNIIDALRWVMGEQSVKQLRGKSMEDVIFAGSKGKAPLNMAEVSLTLLNDNGSAPEELKDFTEINITRRLFRSGESAYFINRQPCRLKDIHHIFMGTGMGARTYAVIQQGNIGAITDATPEERRLYLEEAAGVTRYKNRKKEAIRKVDSTHQNLLRVNDILLEISRQMAGLKRQARKAERFKKFKQQAANLDIRLGLHYYDEYAAKIKATQTLLNNHKDRDVKHISQLKTIDAAVEAIKLKRQHKNQEISQHKSRQFDTQREIDRSEAHLAHLKSEVERLAQEVSDLESAKTKLISDNQDITAEIRQVESEAGSFETEKQTLEAMVSEKRETVSVVKSRIAELNQKLENHKTALMDLVAQDARNKNTYQTASSNRDNLKQRRKRIAEESAAAAKEVGLAETQVEELEKALHAVQQRLEALHASVRTLEGRLDQRKQRLADRVKQVQTLEFEKNQTRSQLAALKKMDQSYAWYKDGVQSIMKACPPSADTDRGKDRPSDSSEPRLGNRILGLMADIIEPEPSYETAVEAVLGESLQYILVEDQHAGLAGIDYLQTSGAGRAGFVPVASVKPLSKDPQKPTDASQKLINHLAIKTGYEAVVTALLGHVVVLDDMAAALEQFNANGKTQTIVTKNGNLITHQGIAVGGSKEKLSGILAKKQEMKTLSRNLDELDAKLGSAREDQHELETEVRGLETRLQRDIERQQGLSQTQVETEKQLYKATADLDHARQHMDILELEQERLRGEENDLDEQLQQFKQSIADIEQKVENAREQVSQTTCEIQDIDDQAQQADQELVDLQLKLTTIDAGIENSRHTLKRLQAFLQDGESRLKRLSADIRAKSEKRVRSQEQIRVQTKDLEHRYRELKDLESTLERCETDYRRIDDELKKNDARIQGLKDEREKTLQKIRLLELDQSQRIVKQENIAGRLEEKYHQPLEGLRARQASDEQRASLPVERMEADLASYRQKIDRIGDVNLSAIQEYEALKQRHDFLTEQRDDLVNAIEDLHKVIRKINRITQDRFMQTFAAVNSKLSEVAPRLFEGGSAKLILTNPDDPLETGVEFMVHPPGKKLTRMSLLSGGEKALAAIAFIFSIFLIKPTSFCLMDEIDAPLDDANVYRFNNLLQVIGQKSQIIMITHNKRTMEFADTLFGITMGEKGVSKVVSVNFEKPTSNVA